MKKNSKVCVDKKIGFLALFVLITIIGVAAFTSFVNSTRSYQSRAQGAAPYIAKFDKVTKYTYVSDGGASTLAVVQPPKNILDARGWSVSVPWKAPAGAPNKPDAVGGVCYLRIDGSATSTSLTFEYVDGFAVTTAVSVSTKITPDGTEKCIFDRKTANTLIVHDGKIIGVVSPPVYVKSRLEKTFKALVPWHSQGRPNNFDIPIGSFTVITNFGTDAESSYVGKLTQGYQASL